MQGADQYAVATNGLLYLTTYQFTTGQRSKLHKVIVSNLTSGTPLYLWIFDLAAGTSTSVAPRIVCLCPAGICTTLDLTDGSPFVNGIFIAMGTNNCASPQTQVTAPATNTAIIEADYRLE
jgi:hypothetical protein